MILRFYGKSHFQHLAQNVGYLNALTVTFALDPPLQIGRNVDVQRFLLRHNTVTNPAVYRIDIHAHRPWLVVMQPLASECAESLYVIYIRIDIRPMGTSSHLLAHKGAAKDFVSRAKKPTETTAPQRGATVFAALPDRQAPPGVRSVRKHRQAKSLERQDG